MAESILIGAGIGAGTSMLTGNDPLKGAMIGGATGGVASGVSGGAAAGAEGVTSTVPSHLTSEAVGSTVANGTMNPALTNGLGQSSNMLTQFGRDASEMATNAYDNVTDTIGGGFDYLNDKTGMENKDWTQMAMTQGINSMQPNPQQPITHAVPQIMKQQYEPTQAQTEGMLTSNPRINQELRKRGLL